MRRHKIVAYPKATRRARAMIDPVEKDRVVLARARATSATTSSRVPALAVSEIESRGGSPGLLRGATVTLG